MCVNSAFKRSLRIGLYNYMGKHYTRLYAQVLRGFMHTDMTSFIVGLFMGVVLAVVMGGVLFRCGLDHETVCQDERGITLCREVTTIYGPWGVENR